jgi:hypothetical protein
MCRDLYFKIRISKISQFDILIKDNLEYYLNDLSKRIRKAKTRNTVHKRYEKYDGNSL